MKKPFAWVIEDDVVLAEIFSTALGLAGFEAATIEDSRNAMAKIMERKPALITLDMQMPHVSGLDILRQVRAHDQLCDVKIIVVTASAQALQDADIEALADLVVMKPIALHQLVDLAGRLIKFDEGGLLIVDDDDHDPLEETAVMPMPVKIDTHVDAAETRGVAAGVVDESESSLHDRSLHDTSPYDPPSDIALTTTSEYQTISSTGDLPLLDEDDDSEATAVIPMPVRLDVDDGDISDGDDKSSGQR